MVSIVNEKLLFNARYQSLHRSNISLKLGDNFLNLLLLIFIF